MKSTNNKNILTLKCLLFFGFLLALLNVTVSLELEKLEQSATGAPIGITEPLVKDTVSNTSNGTEQKASETAENQKETLRQEGPIVVPPEAAANIPGADDAANGSRGLSSGGSGAGKKGKASTPEETPGNGRSLSYKAKFSSKKSKKQKDSEEDEEPEEEEEEVESRPQKKSKGNKGKGTKPTSKKSKKKGKSAMADDPPKKGKSPSAKGKYADPPTSGSSKQGKGVEAPSSSKKGKSAAKDAPKGRATFIPVQPIRASAGPQQQLVRRVTKNIDGANVKVTTYITDSLDQTELPKSVVQGLTSILSAARDGKSDRGYWNSEGGSSTAWDLKEQVDELDTVIAEKQVNQQPSMALQIIPVSDSEVSEWAAKFGADPSSGTGRSRRSPIAGFESSSGGSFQAPPGGGGSFQAPPNPEDGGSSFQAPPNPEDGGSSFQAPPNSEDSGSFQAPPNPGGFGNSFGFDNSADKANKVVKPVGPGGFEYSTAANKSDPAKGTPEDDLEVDTYKNASKTSATKESSSSSIEMTSGKGKGKPQVVLTPGTDSEKPQLVLVPGTDSGKPQFVMIPGTDSEGNALIVVKFDHSNGFSLDVSPEFVPTYVIQEKLKKVPSPELPYFYTFVTQAKKKDSDPEDTPSGSLLAPELTTIVYKIEENTVIVTQIIYTAQEVVTDSSGSISSSNAAGAGPGPGAGAGSVTPLSQQQYFLSMFAAANIYPTTVAIVLEGSAYYEYVFGAGVEFSTKNWFETLILAQNTAVVTGNLIIPTLTISVSNYQLGIAQLVSLGWNALLSHQITSTFPSNGGNPVTNVEANGEARINPNVVVNEIKKNPGTSKQPSVVPLGAVAPTYGGPSPPAPAPFPNANLNGPSIWSPCLSSQLTTIVYTIEGDRLVLTQIILEAPEVVDENRLTIPLNLQQPFLKYFTDNNIQPSTVTTVEEGAPSFVNTFGPNVPFSTADWFNNILVPQKTAAPASRNPVPIVFETIVNNPDGSVQQIITLLWNDLIAYTIVLGLPSSSWTPPTAVITETGASPLSSNIPVRQIRLGPSGSTETEIVIVNSVNPTFIQTGPDAAAIPKVTTSTSTSEVGTAPTEPSPMLITLLYQKTEGDDKEGKDITQVIYMKRPDGDDGSRNTLVIAGDSKCYKNIFGEGAFNYKNWLNAFNSYECGLKATAGKIPTAPSITETSEQTPEGLLWRIKINLHLSASIEVSANPFTVLSILFPNIGGSPKTVVTEITVDGTPRLAGSNEIIQKEISNTGSVLATTFTKKYFTFFEGWNWKQISPKFTNTKIITTKLSPYSTVLPSGGFGSIITSLLTLAISGAGNLPTTVLGGLGGLGGITGMIPGIGGKLPIGNLGGITGKLPLLGGKLPIGSIGGITGMIPGIGGKLPIGSIGGITGMIPGIGGKLTIGSLGGGIGGIIPGAVATFGSIAGGIIPGALGTAGSIAGGIIPGALGTAGSIAGGIIPGVLGSVGGLTAVIPGVGGNVKPGVGGKLSLQSLGGITAVIPGVGGKLPLQSLGGVTSVVQGGVGGLTSVVPGGVGGLTAVVPGGVSKLPSGAIQTATGLLTNVGSVGGGVPILGGLLSSGLGTATSGLGSLALVTGGGNNNVGLKTGGGGNLIGSGKKIKITVKKTQTNTNLLGSLGLRSMGDTSDSGYLPMAEDIKTASRKTTEGTTFSPVHETTVAP